MEQHARSGRRPIDILDDLKAKDPAFWERHIEPKKETIAGALTTPIEDLVRHDKDDPNELIASRFLCKGGAMLFAGPTGVGKSSFMMQLALSFAAGRQCFGLIPPRKLRILLIQAENDEGDLAEMRDGVMAGLSLTPRAIDGRLRVLTNDSSSGERFGTVLNTALHGQGYDMAIADPAFAYLGGDGSKQSEVGPFLRNTVNPIIHRHNVGFVLVHHTNKPSTGAEKKEWQASELAYLGAGSAEFSNWARAIMAIQAVGSETVFRLVASKRGRRLSWRDDNGAHTTAKFIAYHRDAGIICWREATPEEMREISPASNVSLDTVIDIVSDGVADKKDIAKVLMDEHGVKKAKAYYLIAELIEKGYARVSKVGKDNRQTITLTAKAKREDGNAKPDF